MQDNHSYFYYAFISCSPLDKKAAIQLHRKIESFRITDSLWDRIKYFTEGFTEGDPPKRIYPLYLDFKDLLPEKSIPREQTESKFLIVICSPNAAKSEWVNRDVENFILMGRHDRIIPYIIEGTPNSGDPKTECLPPILRRNRKFINYSFMSPEENAERQTQLHEALDDIHDTLFDDIHDESPYVSQLDDGAERSMYKLVAYLLGVDNPYKMINYYLMDKLKRQTTSLFWLLITLLFLFILSFCQKVWSWYNHAWVHVNYFADYVERWNVPEGIFPLSDEQRAHRQSCYRISTRNKKVIRLEHVNSVGDPVPVEDSEFQDRPMIAVYHYNLIDGRMYQRDSLDQNKHVVLSYRYSGAQMQKVEFKSVNGKGRVCPKPITNATLITNNHSLPEDGKSGEIGNMLLIRDSEGRVTEERFQKGSVDVPATDEQGIAGFQYKRDEYGRVIEKQYLALDDALPQDKYGVARRTNRYDENGNLVEAKYFDQNGNLTPNELGWMHCIRTFNKNGNLVEEKYVDASGKLSPSNALAAKFICSYDAQGNRIRQEFFGIDGKPCLNKDGYYKVLRKYDKQSKLINETFFDLNDKPVEVH